ncbi:unnamed protein product [Effrenium voratum]|nr:unnamed protein product [Effrenium voratum]
MGHPLKNDLIAHDSPSTDGRALTARNAPRLKDLPHQGAPATISQPFPSHCAMAGAADGSTVFMFGKHKGRSFQEVAQSEPSYCAWALKMESPSGALQDFVTFLGGARKEPREVKDGLQLPADAFFLCEMVADDQFVVRCEKQGGKEGTAFLPPHLWHAIGALPGAVQMNRSWAFPASSYEPVMARLEEMGKAEGVPWWVRKLLKAPREAQGLQEARLPDGLMPYQLEGVEFGLSRNGRVLLADDMGLGKTLQALALARQFPEWPVLVVCPSSLRWVWKEQAISWFSETLRPEEVQVIQKGSDQLCPKAQMWIISYNLLASDAKKDPYIDRAMAVMRACLLALVSVVKCADLACTDAEPQSPRDVTPGYVGHLTTRYEPYGEEERRNFLQANLHFHLGAEHRSAGEYDQDPPTSGLESTVAPGLFCKTDGLTAPELADYTFEHCKNVSVGNTYEFHWVFSTGAPGQLADDGNEGELGIADGLGGAFARTVNADVIVRGQVCLIYNNASLDTDAKTEADYADFLTKWRSPKPGQAVKYVGSTTGSSYNNVVCSPAEGRFQRRPNGQPHGLVIADESHNIKDWSAARTKVLVPLLRQASRAVLLSGTPIRNAPDELHPQLCALMPELNLRIAEFRSRYCLQQLQNFGGRQVNRVVGSRCAAELNFLLTSTVVVEFLVVPDSADERIYKRLEQKKQDTSHVLDGAPESMNVTLSQQTPRKRQVSPVIFPTVETKKKPRCDTPSPVDRVKAREVEDDRAKVQALLKAIQAGRKALGAG